MAEIVSRTQPENSRGLLIARFATYLIVFVLVIFNMGLTPRIIVINTLFFFAILGVDFYKIRSETNSQLYLTLTVVNLTITCAYGIFSNFTLYMILYFVYVVDYYMCFELKGIYLIVGLIYFFNIVSLYFLKYGWLGSFIHLLVLTSMIIFALVMGTLVAQQKRERLKVAELQVQLIQQEKMASLGQLTAGVVHEINSPLGAIHSNVETIEMVINMLTLLGETAIQGEAYQKALKLVDSLKKANENNKMACERIEEILKKLKNFSRLDEAEWQEADLNEGLDSVVALIQHECKSRIVIHKDYGDLPKLICVPNLINQVTLNIILNAIQAIEGEGDIYITTAATDKYIYIKIRDTGKGIPKENLGRIFDPGFTTKGVGVGTGLGLSISYNIVQKHRGEIILHSEEGKGAEFIVKLPVK